MLWIAFEPYVICRDIYGFVNAPCVFLATLVAHDHIQSWWTTVWRLYESLTFTSWWLLSTSELFCSDYVNLVRALRYHPRFIQFRKLTMFFVWHWSHMTMIGHGGWPFDVFSGIPRLPLGGYSRDLNRFAVISWMSSKLYVISQDLYSFVNLPSVFLVTLMTHDNVRSW